MGIDMGLGDVCCGICGLNTQDWVFPKTLGILVMAAGFTRGVMDALPLS